MLFLNWICALRIQYFSGKWGAKNYYHKCWWVALENPFLTCHLWCILSLDSIHTCVRGDEYIMIKSNVLCCKCKIDGIRYKHLKNAENTPAFKSGSLVYLMFWWKNSTCSKFTFVTLKPCIYNKCIGR